jgi:hypothetical protein
LPRFRRTVEEESEVVEQVAPDDAVRLIDRGVPTLEATAMK